MRARARTEHVVLCSYGGVETDQGRREPKLMSDTLTSSETRRLAECERWMRILRSRRDAGVCALCGTAIAPGEPVVIRRMDFANRRWDCRRLPLEGRAAICAACAPPDEFRRHGVPDFPEACE